MILLWQQLLLLRVFFPYNCVAVAAADHTMAMVEAEFSSQEMATDSIFPEADSAAGAAGRASRRRRASQPARGRASQKAPKNNAEVEPASEHDDDELCWLCGKDVEEGEHGT